MEFADWSDRFSAHFHHKKAEQPNAELFERHCHDCYELLYVVSGSGKYVVEGTEYPLSPGMLMLLRPYEYHYVCPGEEEIYERYVINFGSEFPLDFANSRPFLFKSGNWSGNGVYFPPDLPTKDAIRAFRLLDSILPSMQKDLQKTLLQTIVTQILLLLPAEQKKTASGEESTVSHIIEYLNLHLTEDLSLDEIAKEFFLSKYYLCRSFRKSTGVSPIHYVNTKRVLKALQMISDGTPATEAAMLCGFHDYSVFYRACKKLTGLPPAKKRA